jgi:hypothetical protein
VALEIDVNATEALRTKLRADRSGNSLTEYFAKGDLLPVSPPASAAGNREFGIE